LFGKTEFYKSGKRSQNNGSKLSLRRSRGLKLVVRSQQINCVPSEGLWHDDCTYPKPWKRFTIVAQDAASPVPCADSGIAESVDAWSCLNCTFTPSLLNSLHASKKEIADSARLVFCGSRLPLQPQLTDGND
jgi:hypothetical protein